MWSRAKRASGQRGERIGQEVWAACSRRGKGAEVEVEVEVVQADKAMDEWMDEAVERGYGSDAEVKESGLRRRAGK